MLIADEEQTESWYEPYALFRIKEEAGGSTPHNKHIVLLLMF